MNLKEAKRYANYLSRLALEARNYLTIKTFVTSTKECHYCSKAYSEAQDFEKETFKNVDVEFTPNQVLDFAMKVLNEQDKLAMAINKAKINAEIDVDAAIAGNKRRQSFVEVLQTMDAYKPKTTKTTAIGYKLDVEGKQVSYRYDVDMIMSIDFNRDDVRGMIKKLLKESDATSNALDRIDLTTEVDYTPIWDVNDTFEEAVLS